MRLYLSRAKTARPRRGADQFNLRAKGLAATLAACAQNLTATWRSFASEETVAACAHEIARLECTLHIVLEISVPSNIR